MRRGGFSLVEISIVLVVISVMISGVLPYITESQKTNATNDTAERLEAIELAMLTFRAANGFIPCPSDITAALNGSNFGAATTSADCRDGTAPDANFGDTADFGGTGFTVAGGVPTRALGLSDEYGFDGWGRRMTYHVDTRLTVAGTYSSATGGSIRVNDATGTARTTAAAYAVVSHGPNGHGAYTRAGTRFSFGTTNANEQENCECNASATATTYDNILVQSMAMPNTDPLAAFDDIVRYQLKSSLELLVGGGGGSGGGSDVSFRAATTTVTTGADPRKINFTSTTFDTASAFDFTTNDRFTVPADGAGKYIITLSANGSGFANNQALVCYLYKNGANWGSMINRYPAAGTNVGCSISQVFDLAAGDFIEAYISDASGQVDSAILTGALVGGGGGGGGGGGAAAQGSWCGLGSGVLGGFPSGSACGGVSTIVQCNGANIDAACPAGFTRTKGDAGAGYCFVTCVKN